MRQDVSQLRRVATQIPNRHVYALHMLKERLQILVSTDQRRRLEHEAQRRGTSVASVIRDAVDAQLGEITVEDRRSALDEILAMRGHAVSPDELDRIAEGERDEQLETIARHAKR
jgi:hypothetical protein